MRTGQRIWSGNGIAVVERRHDMGEDEEICEHCDHPVSLHEAEYGCEYEKDVPDPDIGWRAWRCGCTKVVKS